MSKDLLSAPCIFCNYSGGGYWMSRTHDTTCPWYNVTSYITRSNDLRKVIETILDKSFNVQSFEVPNQSAINQIIEDVEEALIDMEDVDVKYNG